MLRHRREQEDLARDLGVRIAPSWRLVERGDRDSEAAWLRVVLPSVREAYERSRVLSVEFVNDLAAVRAMEAGVEIPRPVGLLPGRLSPDAMALVPPEFDAAAASRELLAAGPGTLAREPNEERGRSSAIVNSAGAATSIALTGGREVVKTLATVGVVQGWQRVCDVTACAFCAMLAAKGPVFKNIDRIAQTDVKWSTRGVEYEDNAAKVHWNCKCTIVPVIGSEDFGAVGWADVANDLWAKLDKDEEFKGLPWQERFRRFRREFDGYKKRHPSAGVIDEAVLREQAERMGPPGAYVNARVTAAVAKAMG